MKGDKKMNAPGFTAEKSLYRSDIIYRMVDSGRAKWIIHPAFGIDCYPMCMIFASNRCKGMCPPYNINCNPICKLEAERKCRNQCKGLIDFRDARGKEFSFLMKPRTDRW